VTGRTEAPTASRLLYIDDDQALCYLVKKGLERRGYSVSTATSGPAGVALAAAEPFDLIAIDHYMPGQDGLATLGDLRGLSDAPPVVYVTASDESRIAVAALKEGAIDYVVKTGSEDFIDLLSSALRQAEEQIRLRKERDAATEALRAANARLESIVDHQKVLLREVNHRVANSLQLVSTLVHMQLSAVTDGPARDALRDTQTRIDAIMQIHRRLYTSENVEVVDMQDYLQGLVEELRQSLVAGDGRRTITLNAAPVNLPTDSAVSVGVVVAELVTNACKYAYPAGAEGEVRIVLTALGAGGCRLVVEDDGEGFSAADPAKGTGLGRTVITAMARNLNTKIAYDAAHKGGRAVLDIQG
jgi:two-component sensor histidine kinase